MGCYQIIIIIMIAKSFEKFDGHNQKHPLTQLEILIKYP